MRFIEEAQIHATRHGDDSTGFTARVETLAEALFLLVGSDWLTVYGTLQASGIKNASNYATTFHACCAIAAKRRMDLVVKQGERDGSNEVEGNNGDGAALMDAAQVDLDPNDYT